MVSLLEADMRTACMRSGPEKARDGNELLVVMVLKNKRGMVKIVPYTKNCPEIEDGYECVLVHCDEFSPDWGTSTMSGFQARVLAEARRKAYAEGLI